MKRLLVLVYAFTSIIFISSALNGQDLPDSDMIENANTYLSRLVPFGFNGTVLISHNERILLNKGYGMANPEKDIHNGPDIIYSMGSIVKPFTATLVMKLVQDGKIELSDQLEKYFSDVPDDKKSINIHQLLTHSSGLPGSIGPDEEYITKENYIHEVWETPLAFNPGKRYMYSNVGFTILAMILEKVTGEKYEPYLYETILKPAGMKNTGYTLPDWDVNKLAHNFSGGHDNGTFLDRDHFPTWHLIGNGGMLSTTEDMYRFHLLIKGNQLLTEETKKKMFTPVFMEDAYGWVNMGNGEIIQHNGGSSDGNGALFRWFPRDDVFIMIFTNFTFQGKPGFFLVQQPLEDIVFGHQISFPTEIKETKEKLSPEKLEGSYELSDGAAFAIHCDLKTLQILPENQPAVSLLFNSPDGLSIWNDWNDKISLIMKAAVEEEKYGGLAEITEEPDRLKGEIENEIEMEGYENPEIKILFTIQINPGIKMTMVAISDTDFDDESMLMQLYFENDKFVGMGVDFGEASLPEMTFAQVSQDHFSGYNFNFNKECALSIIPDQTGRPSSMIFNEGPEIKILSRH